MQSSHPSSGTNLGRRSRITRFDVIATSIKIQKVTLFNYIIVTSFISFDMRNLKEIVKSIILYLINHLIPTKLVHCHHSYKSVNAKLMQQTKNAAEQINKNNIELENYRKNQLDVEVLQYATQHGKDKALYEVERRFALSVLKRFTMPYHLGMTLTQYHKSTREIISHYKESKFSFLLNPFLRIAISSEQLNQAEYHLVKEYVDTKNDQTILPYFYSMLIERHEIEILNKFVADYGIPDTGNEMFLSLLHWQVENKYIATISHQVEKALSVYHFLEHNSADSHALFGDKSIAIVGNAPTETGRNRGPLIDKADLVLRFNEYAHAPEFNNDYGAKTDIWATALRCKPPCDTEIPKYFTATIDYKICPLTKSSINDLFTYITEHNPINVKLDQVVSRAQIRSSADTLFPSSGLFVIHCMNQIMTPEQINLYAFKMIDQEREWADRHYQISRQGQVFKGTWHSWDQEKKYLSEQDWYSDQPE